jgi:asparagine synthase (glutamine-hydrolysing)
MCGLAGIFSSNVGKIDELEPAVRRMIDPIVHRGPDDSGVFADHGVALGFRRLAIIDLSANGHQPMRSGSGRFTMVFNGEVYNHEELRRELEASGFRFRGHSDTEVMLAAFEHWGIQAAVRRFVGMFAIALWDAADRSLSLMRDRLGIKPLFIYSEPGLITFGSELRSLMAGPSFDRAINPTAISSYLRYLYVPAPATIYKRATKLLPGHVVTIRSAADPLPASTAFWSAEEVAERGIRNHLELNDQDAIDQLEQLLREAVRLRMQADVPLGALLSGGIDSSTVVALMQEAATNPVKTFSIGFDIPEYNESAHAREVANHLGTEHHELMLTGEDALAVVPKLADIFDEPLADPSQIPTFLVSQLARRQVTVALSGDGGDELFAGYNRYTFGEKLVGRAARTPKPLRRLAAAAIGSVSSTTWDQFHKWAEPALPRSLRMRLAGDKLQKMSSMIRWDTTAQMYRSLLSAWDQPERLLASAWNGRVDQVERIMLNSNLPTLLDRMMLADQTTYLPDDLLAKVDRASMAVSLEARVPLLDHRVVEFAWRLPRSMKIRDGQGKWILRQVLYRHVPKSLVERPKMGFSVPIETWLRKPLRSWAEDLLASSVNHQDSVLRREPLYRAWNEFQRGESRLAPGLWAVLMLEAWRQRWAE